MRLLLALALFAGMTTAAPVPKAVKKKTDDATDLVGTWRAVPGARDESFQFTADGKMAAWSGKGGHGGSFPYTWTIDPTTAPKTMNWGDASTPPRPQFECVYELNGDTLRIAYSTVGKRPANPTAAANGNFICDLVRDTPAK